MAVETEYQYSVQNSFPNHKVNNTLLVTQVRASAISVAIDYVSSSGDVLSVWMKDALGTTDKSTLDGLVAAHDGSATPDASIPVTIAGDNSKLIDPYTHKLITQDQRYNGPLYVPFCNFTTGKGSSDPTWSPPPSNSTNNFWSIDVTTAGLTKVTFAPNFNYQCDGLGYRVFGTISNPTFVKQVILNPQIPANQGGNYVFAEGHRLITNDAYQRFTDPKFVPKSVVIGGNTIPTNVLQFVVSHDPGDNISMEVFTSVYPQ
jgi:hypothetical protein